MTGVYLKYRNEDVDPPEERKAAYASIEEAREQGKQDASQVVGIFNEDDELIEEVTNG